MRFSINQFARCGEVSLLLRHAQRYPIPENQFGNDIDLTPEGFTACHKLGDFCAASINNIYTSPVLRCVSTAKAILRDNKQSQIFISTLLGGPGIYIEDPAKAGQHFLSSTPYQVIDRLLQESRGLSGFVNDINHASGKLLKFITQHNHSKYGVNIYITHDSILALLLSYLYPNISLIELWPDYLTGILILSVLGKLQFYRITTYEQLVSLMTSGAQFDHLDVSYV